ncbi:MAG: UdgX family uracil-DNA binding protein [Nitrospiraceae bacterium]
MRTKSAKAGRSAADFLPSIATLSNLRRAAAACRGCDLYQRATQTVFGEGAGHANVVLIGEQPGDQEDRTGHPFVGPAGRLLDKALSEAGISGKDVYVTNAVKHFKWKPLGKRRKHKRPSAVEVAACRPWLVAELKVIRPTIVVCMGVTAARSALRRTVRLNTDGGKFHQTEWSMNTFVTIHPSSVLRHPEKTQQELEYRRLVHDLKLVQARLLDMQG